MIISKLLNIFNSCDVWTIDSNIYIHGANPNDLNNLRSIMNINGIYITYSTEVGRYKYRYQIDGVMLLTGVICMQHAKTPLLVKGARCYKLAQTYFSRDIYRSANLVLKRKNQPREIRKKIIEYVAANNTGPKIYSFRIY